MPSPTQRTCRKYERVWRGRCVDKNLADEWLHALNALHSLTLISICEGHVGERGEQSLPHLNFRLKPELVSAAYAVWDKLSIGLAAEFVRLLSSEVTVAEAELRLRVRFGRGGATKRPDAVVKLRSVRARTSIEMEPEATAWFTEAVAQVQAIDRLLSVQLIEGHQDSPGDTPTHP